MTDLDVTARQGLLSLSGYFAHPVRVKSVEEISSDVFLVQVRHGNGGLNDTQLTREELQGALAATAPTARLVDQRMCSGGWRASGFGCRSPTIRCSRCR